MDDYVRNKLNEWGLSECIERFEDEGIDKESLFCLHDQDIDNLISKIGPRTKFKRRLKLLKEEQNTTNLEAAECHQNAEEAADPAQNFARMSNIHVHPQVYLSASDAKIEGKRKLDGQGSSSQWQSSPTKRRHDPIPRSYSDEIILADVKTIMRCVNKRIPNQDNKKLNKFLKDTINNLETDKRELVGVFGRTGAGKSSLINAVIGEKNLLPSGSVNACTSVMIKVEANMLNGKYEADIEFIAKEEWKDELWSLFNFLGNNADQEKDQEDDDYRDTNEKLSAVYGEECKNINNENLFDNKYFKEIPEFLNSRNKTLTCDSAKELSARFVKYTRTDPNDSESKDVKKWHWPLVKCVTIRVPNNDLLKHVTLVDLPGNGDRNKSRDTMWKEVVGSCSTVWIVTDINRAVSEKEPWEVLESACSLMGNGGECKHIHFICTKSDLIEDSDAHSAAVPGLILKRNVQAKEAVKNEFGKSKKIKKHFSGESFQVFTVSSKEFQKEKRLTPDDTEIPKLQEFLQNLNDSHSEIKNYVSRAHGILSLIQGASCREAAAHEMDVCTVLEEKLRHELDEVRKPMEEAHEAFVKCLSEGVEKSRSSCETMLKSFLYPRGMKGGAFHRRLKCVVQNNGTHKPKKGKEVNLNVKLASCLTDTIDEEFRKTFPNEGKSAPFNGVINTFSLDTVRLIEKHKDVELQLIFLESEEEKIRTLLHKNIRERKKTIYSSLTTTIEKCMHECYEKAAQLRGKDSMKSMRSTIENHVHELKDIMFEQAKNEMLNLLSDLKESTLKKLEETMQESIDLSLKTDGDSIPAVKVELEEVKRYYKQLKGTPDEVIEIC